MNNLQKFSLCTFCCFILVFLVSAAADSARAAKGTSPDYIFYKGNTLYEEGKYEEAIREYEGLLEQGLESGNIYYNIGNCYFKKGDIGRAILNYERARKLIPGDRDVESNYAYARSMIKGGAAGQSVPWFRRVFSVFAFLSLNGLTVFISGVFACTGLFLVSGLFIHPLKRYYRFVLPVLLVVFMAGAFSLYSRVSLLGREAVIVSGSADAKFEPLDNATTYFTVHEGMKVCVIESKRSWSKVKRFDGKTGWLRTETLENI